MNVAIIGGGAAGFFAAIAVKENYPQAGVIILEKSNKLLAKVKVSGGGRCNVTNNCTVISELIKAYPRGGKKLRKPFEIFNTLDTKSWFEKKGVKLVAEQDGRIFPKTNKSQTIIDCLIGETERLGVGIETGVAVVSIDKDKTGFLLVVRGEEEKEYRFDKVIIATGGSPKLSGFDWLAKLGHSIEVPVPSLFTFNMPKDPITKLMGVVAPDTLVSIQGTKLKSTGPLLITHWGMSGPAIIKLSSFGARLLSEKNYNFSAQVNWIGETNNELVIDELRKIITDNPGKQLINYRPYGLATKLWLFLVDKAGIRPQARWDEIGKKGLNMLTNLLTNDIYHISGKTTFKEEFVTCGGVSLESVNLRTMESTACPGLYFAGEVLDIDAITGGYNFQAAWTTGFIAGKLS